MSEEKYNEKPTTPKEPEETESNPTTPRPPPFSIGRPTRPPPFRIGPPTRPLPFSIGSQTRSPNITPTQAAAPAPTQETPSDPSSEAATVKEKITSKIGSLWNSIYYSSSPQNRSSPNKPNARVAAELAAQAAERRAEERESFEGIGSKRPLTAPETATPASTPTKILTTGKFYKVTIDHMGAEFIIKSGSAGRFSIDDVGVTIRDLQDAKVFTHEGEKNGRVTLEDDPGAATTNVTYHPPARTEKIRRTSWESGSMKDVIEAGKLILSHDFNLRTYNGPDFVRIVVRENQHVLLKSKLLTVIAGRGGHIQISDSANVYANLPMASLSHVGRGRLLFAGYVEGDCTQHGPGKINIEGSIGELIQKRGGTVEIKGCVRGPVHQEGNLCNLKISGAIYGPIRQEGEGHKIVREVTWMQ